MSAYRYPLRFHEKKKIRDNYTGDIFIWDVDKTYLATEFDSFRKLIRIPFEKGEDKVAISGTVPLLKELSRGSGDISKENPIYFITATPPQLSGAIEDKLEIDTIPYFGITYKDNLSNIRKGKFLKIREQLSYKLAALLIHRRRVGTHSKEFLFGDDSESDALIYCLYSDIASGRLTGERLRRVLESLGLPGEDRDYILRIKGEIPDYDPVEQIYITLSEDTAVARFALYGDYLLPSIDTLQTAIHLWVRHRISGDGLIHIAKDLMRVYGYTASRILFCLSDLYERGFVDPVHMRRLSGLMDLPPWFSFREPLINRFRRRLKKITRLLRSTETITGGPYRDDGALRTPHELIRMKQKNGENNPILS
jgi:hypothetical protein